jgi:hypothetical protein
VNIRITHTACLSDHRGKLEPTNARIAKLRSAHEIVIAAYKLIFLNTKADFAQTPTKTGVTARQPRLYCPNSGKKQSVTADSPVCRADVQ